MAERLRAPANTPIVQASFYPTRAMAGWMERLTAAFLVVDRIVKQRVIDGGAADSDYAIPITLNGGDAESAYDALRVLDLGGADG